ncbi:MAG: hypothetical protein JNM50_11250 [Chromatiales bacterium]|nr:hypothetical protein [Chromatiales bacterium]
MFYDLIDDAIVPVPALLDGFVLGILFYAMQHGQPIHAHGRLSRQFLRNVFEYQSVWAVWRPDRYQQVDIVPDEIDDEYQVPARGTAIATFSGGVDGTFTAIRHSQGLLGEAGYPLGDVLLIHGFDVPLDRQQAFDDLSARLKPVVAGLGLRLHRLRTNLKKAVRQGWEHSFGAQMASALHNFSHAHRYALFGSGEPYHEIVYPWGSTPIADHLLSGSAMQLVHDGAAYSRTEKCALLVQYPQILGALQVCWEGTDRSHNCGRCEKCIRTKMNLLAVGAMDPGCFSQPLEINDVLRLRPQNRVQVGELKSILSYAGKHGLQGAWIDALATVVAQFEGEAPVSRHPRFLQSLRDLLRRR